MKFAPVRVMAWSMFVLLLANHANAQIWSPYIEFGGQGSEVSLGQGNLFLPLSQDANGLTFADLRGMWTDIGVAEGNWGLANRQLLGEDLIVGGYGFYDLRVTDNASQFRQVTLGMELLSQNWGVRGNGYIPLNREGNGSGTASIVDNRLVMLSAIETSYHGFDLEAERLLWFHSPAAAPGASFWESLDAELWASAGVFHFDTDQTTMQNITGPRLRAELRAFDLALLGAGSRLVIGAEYRHDDVRGSVGSGLLAVRIPFGAGASSYRRGPHGIYRRMVTPVVRDVDVVTADNNLIEQARTSNSSTPIGSVTTIDGSTADPGNVIETAGRNAADNGESSLVVVQGDQGDIHAGSRRLEIGQTLVGGGSTIQLIGTKSGTQTTFTAPGTRPTMHTTLSMRSGTGITGIDVQGGSDIFTINTTNGHRDDILIQHVNIYNSGYNGSGILNDSSAKTTIVRDSNIYVTGQNSTGIKTLGYGGGIELDYVTIKANNDGSAGIAHTGSGQLHVKNSTIESLGTSGQAVNIALSGSGLIQNSRLTSTQDAVFARDCVLDIQNSDIISHGRNGVLLSSFGLRDSGSTYRINNSAITSAEEGVFITQDRDSSFRSPTMNVTLTNNTIKSTGKEAISALIDSSAGEATTFNANIQGNHLYPRAGKDVIQLDVSSPTSVVNITQGPPGTSTGLAHANHALFSQEVTITGNGTINFNQPAPATP